MSRAIERLRENEVMAAERISNEVAIRLQHAGLTTRSWPRQGEVWSQQGNVASEILATVDLERPDVVVVGPRGRSGLVKLWSGPAAWEADPDVGVSLRILGEVAVSQDAVGDSEQAGVMR